MSGNIPKDPVMLMSFANLKLRDFYQNLDAMCEDLEINRADLEAKLAMIDSHYDSDQNRFV